MSLSPFGKRVRKLRIDADLLLAEMADFMNVSTSYLSSVETGRKPLTPAIARNAIAFFASKGIDATDLQGLADESVKAIPVENLQQRERRAVAALARRFESPTEEDKALLEQIETMIKETA
jgi:transcriptional regulator with XRE-family HTH domain